MDRWEFQRKACAVVACVGGKILNIGAEIDPAGLKAKFNAVNLDINRFDCTDVIADACHLPFPDKSFDLVVCGDVLEHIVDYKTAIGEAGRVGKAMIATIPSLEYEEKIGHIPPPYPCGEHVWKPTQDEIKELFPSAKVKYVKTDYWIGFLIFVRNL